MLRRTRYDDAGLMDMSRSSRYWYRGGVEPRALSAWALAIVTGYQFVSAGTGNHVWFTGVFATTWLGKNGLGWIITFIVAAGLYALLGGARAVENEAR